MTLIFDLRGSMLFVQRLGANPVIADDIAALHLRHAAHADPDDLRHALTESMAKPVAGGTRALSGD